MRHLASSYWIDSPRNCSFNEELMVLFSDERQCVFKKHEIECQKKMNENLEFIFNMKHLLTEKSDSKRCLHLKWSSDEYIVWSSCFIRRIAISKTSTVMKWILRKTSLISSPLSWINLGFSWMIQALQK